MIKVKVVRANRGFWKDLFYCNIPDIEFVYENVYSTEDINSNAKKLTWKLSQLRILDFLGIYQQIKAFGDYDLFFSYNRFLKANRPYVLTVENPIAMVHYHPQRAKSFFGRVHLNKTLKNKNLNTIVCLSKACESTMNFYYNIPKNVKIVQIYPLIKYNISREKLTQKIEKKGINCLFISSNFYLKGGGELIKAIKDNKWYENSNLHFDIITKKSTLEPETIELISEFKNVNLYDFNFSKEELNAFYKKADLLINLTRMDSFSLVTLEAMHFGCAFITTSMYAISEMVINDYNGYITEPTVKFWNDDNTKNEKITQQERKKLFSNYIDERIYSFLTSKLEYLLKNEQKLKEFEKNSYELSNSKFSSEKIKEKWEKTLKGMI